MTSTNVRRPLEAWEHEPMTLLGEQVRDLRRQAGLSVRQVAEVALLTPRQLERIESAGRRTRRSTLVRVVDTLLLACPDLGELDELVEQLVVAAGAALAPESPYADKSLARRDGKAQRLADRRARYAHLRD